MTLCFFSVDNKFEFQLDTTAMGETRFLEFAKIMKATVNEETFVIDFTRPVKMTRKMQEQISSWCDKGMKDGYFTGESKESVKNKFSAIAINKWFYIFPANYFSLTQCGVIRKQLELLDNGTPLKDLGKAMDELKLKDNKSNDAASYSDIWHTKSRISAPCLYHFTRKMEYLESILINGFRPRIVMEDVSFLMKNYEHPQIGYACVCFCDLPESLLDDHKKKYGNYGIAMTKEWGIKNGINPVMYITDKNALFIENLRDLQARVLRAKSFNRPTNFDKEVFIRIVEMSAFMRLYKDEQNTVPFYDDREWRYLYTDHTIPFDKYVERLLYIPEISSPFFNTDMVNKDLEKCPLKFDVGDVVKVFVTTQEEKATLIERLLKAGKSDKKTLEDLVCVGDRNGRE